MKLTFILMVMLLALPSAQAQITPRRDACDPGKIEFDAVRCREEQPKLANGGIPHEKDAVGARGYWSTSLPIRGDQLESSEDPILVESENLVEDWALSKLSISSEEFSVCDGLGLGPLIQACYDSIPPIKREAYKEHYDHLKVTSVSQLEAELREFSPDRSEGMSSERIQAVLVSYKALAQTTAADMLKVLSTEGGSLPVREKLLVAQRFGGMFFSAYDSARNRAGITAKGVVNLQQMLDFHRAREIDQPHHLGGAYGFPAIDGPQFLGICRDIASAQGEILIAMGFPETYVVAYFPDGALHTTLIIEDPEKKGKFYRMNYGELSTTPGSGPEMLYQDDGAKHQDSTLRYFIHRPAGETLATVPSELGLTIARALRGDAAMDRLAPGYVPKGWSSTADLSTMNHFSLRLFAGQDGRGDRYQGAGIVVRIGDEQSIYTQEMGGAAFMRYAGPLSMQDVFLFYEGTLHSKEVALDDAARVRLHAEAMLYVAALITSLESSATSHPASYAGDVRAAFAVEALFGRHTDRVTGSLRTEAQVTPGVGDIRNVGTVRVQFDQIMAEGSIFFALSKSQEGRAELFKTAAGRAYLYGIVTVLFDHWGQRGITRVGFDSKYVGLEARYSGRVQLNSPIFRPTSVREYGLRLFLKLGSYGTAFAEATRPIASEIFDAVGRVYRVGGQFQIPLRDQR